MTPQLASMTIFPLILWFVLSEPYANTVRAY